MLFVIFLDQESILSDVKILILSIVAHPMSAIASFQALVLAPPAVSRIEQNVDAAPSAADFTIPALFATLPAVLCIGFHVHALLPAAVWTWAPCWPADPRNDIACHWSSRVVVVVRLSQPASWTRLDLLQGDASEKVAEAMSNIAMIMNKIFATINCFLKYSRDERTAVWWSMRALHEYF